MTYPISKLDGIDAVTAGKLKAVGIRTTDALLEAAKTMKGRKALAATLPRASAVLAARTSVSKPPPPSI